MSVYIFQYINVLNLIKKEIFIWCKRITLEWFIWQPNDFPFGQLIPFKVGSAHSTYLSHTRTHYWLKATWHNMKTNCFTFHGSLSDTYRHTHTFTVYVNVFFFFVCLRTQVHTQCISSPLSNIKLSPSGLPLFLLQFLSRQRPLLGSFHHSLELALQFGTLPVNIKN